METVIGNWTVSVKGSFRLGKVPAEQVMTVNFRYNSALPGGEHTLRFSEKEYDQLVKFMADNALELLTPPALENKDKPVLRTIIKASQASILWRAFPSHPGMHVEIAGALKKIDGFNAAGSVLISGQAPIPVHPDVPIFIIY